MSKKIILLGELNAQAAEGAVSERADVVIYTRMAGNMDAAQLPADVRFIYAYQDLRKVIAYAFECVSQQLHILRKKVPALFFYREYDLFHALEKDVFWGTLEGFAVKYQLMKIREEGDNVADLLARPALKRVGGLVRRLFAPPNDGLYKFDKLPVIASNVTGFRINKPDAVGMLGCLPERLPEENMISFQTAVLQTEETVAKIASGFRLNIRAVRNDQGPRGTDLITRIKVLFAGGDPDFKNVAISCSRRLMNHADQYDRLFRAGLRKVFFLAAENEGEGNVAHQAAQRYGAKTFNYANGTKTNDPQNINTYFSYWFMPDAATRRMFLAHGKMTADQLPVCGHLMEEKAAAHVYSGSLDGFKDLVSGKRIIALFTSIFYVNERTDVLACLRVLLERHPDVVVLVRRHPRETVSFTTGHERIVILPAPPAGEGDRTLFDLLCRSSAAITFTSTTSLQASWFRTLAINFEHSPFPKLPHVDDKKVFHVDSGEKLLDMLEKQLHRGDTDTLSEAAESPSEVIARFLLSDSA